MADAENDEAREVVLRLSALGGGPEVLRKAAARALAERAPPQAVELLGRLMRLAQQRWPPALRIVPAFVRALEHERDSIPHAASLRQVAALHELLVVELLFAEGEASALYHPDAAARADAKLFTLPLGHLKTRARLTRNPDELTRLAVASNPAVVREVLRNPRLTETVVVNIAARRPVRPEPLVEIWRAAKWSVRPAVRRALAFNPYLPLEVGVKIVPLLTRSDLLELRGDGALHEALRTQARLLVERDASSDPL
jgi:hypothetical protein